MDAEISTSDGVKTEARLLETGKQWRTIFDAMIDPVFLLDTERRILKANRAAGRLLGMAPVDMKGRHCYELVHQSRIPIEGCPALRSWASGASEKLELELQDRSYLVVSDPVRDEKGKINGTVHSFRDVTKERRAALRLRSLHDLRTAILEVQSVAKIAEAALENVSRLIPAQRVSIAVFDEKAGEALVFATGVLRDELGRSQPVPLDSAFPDIESLRAGKIVQIEDYDAITAPNSVLSQLREAGIRSLLNIPIRSPDLLLGSLNLGYDRPEGFTEEDIEVGREVADSIAIVLEQARLHEALEAHFHDLETKVEQRSSELRRMVNLMTGREIRMAELKQVVKVLRRQLEEAGLKPEADDPLLGGGR